MSESGNFLNPQE